MDLDNVDLKILTILQADARVTNAEIAQRVHMTPPPTLRRTKSLQRRGYISDYHAKLDHSKLGFRASAFVFVKLRSQSKSDLDAFERTVSSWDIVRECYALSGNVDFLLKCLAESAEEFHNFVGDVLRKTANIDSARGAVIVRTANDLPGLPLRLPSNG